MPSLKAKTDSARAFLPLLSLTFLLWIFYRSVFHFPVWFDESIGKFVFFALPVLLYVSITRNKQIFDTFSLRKLKPGLLLGLAIGGLFGFAGVLLGAFSRGGEFVFAPYYLADWFWWELLLALLTGFWETLFFFSFVMVAVEDHFKHFTLFKQVGLVATVFLLFHLPNMILRFEASQIFLQVLLLFAFACGQALIFHNRRNAYVLVIVQAIWGMVLLLNF
jgi:uncharacterized membrane protein